MTRPDPAERPAAQALSQCPAAMWPQVTAFLITERDSKPFDRYKAAAELAMAADGDEEWRAWMLVVEYLEELSEVSDV